MTAIQTIFDNFKKLHPLDFSLWLMRNEEQLTKQEKDLLSDFYMEGYDDGDRRADYQFEEQYNFYTTQNQ